MIEKRKETGEGYERNSFEGRKERKQLEDFEKNWSK